MSQLSFGLVGIHQKSQDLKSRRRPPGKGISKMEARRLAMARGLCMRCMCRPCVIQRKHCRDCLMDRLIAEAFKQDRRGKMPGSTRERGTCYVDQFRPSVRRKWLDEVKSKWNGACFYSGLPIEVGSTAGLDHMLPYSRAHVFGPGKVFHPDNLVWVDKRINILKGAMTAHEFFAWLRVDLPKAITSADANLSLLI